MSPAVQQCHNNKIEGDHKHQDIWQLENVRVGMKIVELLMYRQLNTHICKLQHAFLDLTQLEVLLKLCVRRQVRA